MKRLLVTLGALTLWTLCGSAGSWAQTGITLSGSGGNIKFQGNGPGTNTLTVTVGLCGGPHCTFGGTGIGTGALAHGAAPFTFTVPQGLQVTLTKTATPGFYIASNQTGNIQFDWGTGGSLLAGTVNLTSFQQNIVGHNVVGSQLFAEMAITGGSFASVFSSHRAQIEVRITFPRANLNIASLLGTNASTVGHLDFTGSQITPSPEPTSILLLGTGLLAVGIALRRRQMGA